MSEPLKLVLPTEPSAQTISDQKSIEKDIPAESSLEFDQLPEDEKSMVRDFISQIDITDSTILVQFLRLHAQPDENQGRRGSRRASF